MIAILPRLKIKSLFRLILLSAVIATLFSIPTSNPQAGCGDYFSCNKEIERVKKEITRLQGEEQSLKNQIAYLDNQIYLSELEIQAKEQEVKLLSVDISDLSQRLNRIDLFLKYQEEVFKSRARSAYTSEQLSPFDVVLGADNLDTAFRKIKYLKVLESQDQETLLQMQETKESFNEQKTTLENKKTDVERLKTEVEQHKANLIAQQNAKAQLLQETKGQESNYKRILAQLEAERAEILRALASKGFRLGPVKKKDPIARQGMTGCATGPHVHYSIYWDSNSSREAVGTLTPFSPCGRVNVVGGKCNSSSWGDWWGTVVSGSFFRPVAASNYLTQSYWYINYRINHQALDIVSNDGWLYASVDGVASLVTDSSSYGAVCRANRLPYNGLGYGIRIDAGSIVISYWHVKKP